MRIDICGAQFIRIDIRLRHNKELPIGGHPTGLIAFREILKERRRLVLLNDELIRQRQDIEDAGSAADSQFTVAQWVPGKTYARLKVMKGGVREKRANAAAACDKHATDGQLVTQIAEVDELAVCFRGHGRHLVTQT